MHITKTLLPATYHALDRERLLNRLAEWENKKLVIIHAQAGQGKSALAAGYVQSLAEPSVWYNMDREDDNPSVFLSSLGQAVQRAYPAHLPVLPVFPQNRYPPNEVIQSSGQWINQVFGSIPGQCLVIFDDYHHTSAPPALRDIFKMLITAPLPRVRFMLISRVHPELEIANLRAKKSVGELTSDDLRFSDDETCDLFCSVYGMQIAQNEAFLINRMTEGWPAGLALMHEYLAQMPGTINRAVLNHQLPEKFQDHVFDYLAQEVFSHLSPGLRDFLLRTSITDHLPTGLMELLTGLPATAGPGNMSVATMVRELRSRNLFISATDDSTVVRYHSLFRDFLLKKLLAQTSSSLVQILYTRAINYFIQTQDPVRAVNLCLAARQYDHAVKLMETCGLELIACGRTHTLLRWIDELPPKERDRPWFSFHRALAIRFTDPGSGLTLMERAFTGFGKERRSRLQTVGRMLSLCGIIEACFHTGGDFTRMGRSATLANTLLRQNRRGPSEARARLLLATGMAWFFTGKLQEGTQALRQALELFRKQGDHFYQITCAIYLTPCALYQGEFQLARDSVQQGFEAHAAIPDETGGRAALYLVKAMTFLFEGNFNEARECLDQCKNLADMHTLESIGFLSLDIRGWLMIAQGDYPGAVALLEACKQQGEKSNNAFFCASAAHLLAIAFLFQGKLDQAKKESDYALAIHTRSGSRLFHAIYLIASGAIHGKLGKNASAEKELLLALTMLHQMHASQQEANAHLLLAQLYGIKKNTDLMRKHLQAGFSLGREQRFSYYALFTVAELSALAHAALIHEICTEYCSALLDNLAQTAGVPRLRIFCFNGFRLTRDNTPIRDVAWKSKRAKSLLKLLVANNRKISRDAVMDMLWPGSETGVSPTTLNSLLYRLRKTIDRDMQPGKELSCIVQDGDLLSLNRNVVWTDVGQFLSHLETAGRMRSKRDTEKVIAEYEKAFSLYQGDFLPEDLHSEWAGEMRDQLRLRYLKALQNAGELAESLGHKDKAASFHEQVFSVDPCNETACRWLMTRYLSAGLRGEAIRTYERCERALSRELDLEPEVKTKTLFRNVLAR